ncbi:ricin-type beta-trefoil lectin domain protein [Actinoplanes sp. M2I2]|uniref:ricin-type beta-trefoil lectin domain protein n=1 Tax=Actinoplanes sp. M2I2 TaxID=1734444 RepID=UPI00201FF77A|nr:ricin-type beta-trefoil lectin domain protein [Actinoplanes sp. M2I2]
MTNGDHDDEQDPLLVRPFVLREPGTPDDDESTQTWPAAGNPPPDQPIGGQPHDQTTGNRPPGDADAPTAVFHLPFRRHAAASAPASTNRRRRLIVLAGTAAVVVLGASAAGFAALRDDVRPSVTTGLPGGPLPAATAPLTSSATTSVPATSDATGGRPRAGAATRPSPSAGASSSASPSAGTSSPTVPTGSPSAGEPISLVPPPTGDQTPTTGAPEGIAPSPPSTDRVGVVRGQNSLCLDLNGAVPFDGNHVQVYECNNTIAQSWTLATDGTLRVQGKCALAVGDNSIEVVTCDGRTPAQWRVSGQRLINAATNTCLTDPSGGARAGTGVTVATCAGSASQRWSLP